MKIINFFKIADWEIKKFLLTILLIQIVIFSFIGLEITGIQIPLLKLLIAFIYFTFIIGALLVTILRKHKIKKFISFILLIQIILLGLVGLEIMGIQLVWQLIAFIYLTFIPGILIIRILKMHNLGYIETILYTVGLSLGSLMFIGLFVNTLYPLIGINNPISLNPLILTISAFVLLLLILNYKMDNGFNKEEYFNTNDILKPWILFFLLIPLLVIIGTYLVNYYDNVVPIMSIILFISLIPILIAFNKIPKNLYPLVIFVIAISLLFHTSLISKFISGYDVLLEYHYADIVLKNSFWDPSIFHGYNGVLSVVLLIPLYSIIGNLSLETVIKVIYPFIYSLVPLGLFLLFKNQTNNDKIAFLSVFLFMSIYTFYLEMISLARQEIAELFLVVLLILLFSKKINSKNTRYVLYAIFGVSLVVSHYAIAFMYAFIFLGVWAFLILFRSTKFKILINRTFNTSEKNNSRFNMSIFLDKFSFSNFLARGFKSRIGYLSKETLFSYKKNTHLSLGFVLLLLIFSLLWYYYVSNSYTFINLVYLFNNIYTNITDLLNPASSQGLQSIIREYSSPVRMITKYLYLITQFLTIVGFLAVIFRKYKLNFEDSFIAFSFLNLFVLFASIILPNLAGSFNTSRFYALALLFLAPYSILGIVILIRYFIDKTKSWKSKDFEYSLRPVAVFLAIFLLFNTGFVTEFTNDYSSSMVFDKADWVFFFEHDQDVISAQWLGKYRTGRVYADYFSALTFSSAGYIVNNSNRNIKDTTNDTEMLANWTTVESNGYIYMRYGDIKTVKTRNNNPYYTVLSFNLTKNMNKIYDSNSEIYKSRY
ncbi:DUF2206 domain-containing protein [Methanobacterium oryzae]|uniref:DUF2206 domain-containing protein n=1 Tax=Methanobacterium oryzae TaxID=69540 RepID=UPI003D1AB005